MLCLSGYMFQNTAWTAHGVQPVATWFPVVNLFLFYASSTIGYLIVPWVMVGEVFPRQIRGMMGGVTTCVGHFTIFLVVQTYPLLQELTTKAGTFTVYGFISLLSTLFFYYFCPETKGKTLQEIEESFSEKKSSNKHAYPDIVKNLPKRIPNVVVWFSISVGRLLIMSNERKCRFSSFKFDYLIFTEKRTFSWKSLLFINYKWWLSIGFSRHFNVQKPQQYLSHFYFTIILL